MKMLLLLSLLWGPNIQAHSERSLAEVIYPNTPAVERNNPSVNPTPEFKDEKNIKQTLESSPRSPSSDKDAPGYKTTPKSRTSRPLGPNKR